MTTKQISEENLAYIAGLLDSRKGEIDETGWVYFRHESIKLIDFLKENVGGSSMRYSDTGNYIWCLPDSESKELLTGILPFLIRNKHVAKVVLGLS